ncbi:MAG TPA: hypothetical protein VF234_02250, partial [Limnochordia bacterium]
SPATQQPRPEDVGATVYRPLWTVLAALVFALLIVEAWLFAARQRRPTARGLVTMRSKAAAFLDGGDPAPEGTGRKA